MLNCVYKGANVQMQYSNGDTLLHHAVKRKWYDVIRLLIYRGISVNVCNNKGETPLFGSTYKDMVSATHLINTLMCIVLIVGEIRFYIMQR